MAATANAFCFRRPRIANRKSFVTTAQRPLLARSLPRRGRQRTRTYECDVPAGEQVRAPANTRHSGMWISRAGVDACPQYMPPYFTTFSTTQVSDWIAGPPPDLA